jgi:hypothetical protein
VSALRIDIPRKKSPGLGAICRDMVEAGTEDQPAEVWIDGALCLTVRSIHAVALTTIAEDPSCRRVAWAPHPKFGTVGPRMAALLEAREIDRRLRKEYGA